MRIRTTFMWNEFGRRYAIREAGLYMFGFLLPLSFMVSLLADMTTYEDADNVSVMGRIVAGISSIWLLRLVMHEGKQSFAVGMRYSFDIWNMVDILLASCFGLMALSWLSRELWWCKQAAAVAVVISYLKTAWFLQGTQRPAPCV